MRRWPIAVLAVLMTLAVTAAGAQELPPGGTFTDDDGNAHEGNIEAIAAIGVTAGCGGTRYCPELDVTREQMASFLARAFHLATGGGDRFTDVSGGACRQCRCGGGRWDQPRM